MADVEMVEKEGLGGKKVKIIGPSYEEGSLPNGTTYNWKRNAGDRERYMKYLQQSERYWYQEQDQWFGSEKRKNPA